MKNKSLVIYIIIIVTLLIGLVLGIVYIQNNISSSIVSALIGVLLPIILNSMHDTIKFNSSYFSGYYRNEIFSNDNPNEIIKRSKVRLLEKNGNVLSGSVLRYYPADQSNLSQCKLSGFIVLDQFLLSYRAFKDNIPTRGVVLLKLDTTRQKGLLPCYSGQYYKFEGEKIIGLKVNLIKIDKEEYDKL